MDLKKLSDVLFCAEFSLDFIEMQLAFKFIIIQAVRLDINFDGADSGVFNWIWVTVIGGYCSCNLKTITLFERMVYFIKMILHGMLQFVIIMVYQLVHFKRREPKKS